MSSRKQNILNDFSARFTAKTVETLARLTRTELIRLREEINVLRHKEKHTPFNPQSVVAEGKEPEANRDVHTEHCCALHGCQYGQRETCSVANGIKKQSYPCEYCTID